MPWDCTLHVILDAPAHNLADIEKAARRYRRGDIVNVYLSSEVAESPNPNSRQVFVHVTGVPDAITLQKIKNVVLAKTPDPLDTTGEMSLRRRAWRIPPSVVPTALRNQLIDNREATVTWAQVKPYIRKKIVANRTDPTQDDETTEMTDGDFA